MATILKTIEEYDNLKNTSEKPIILWFTASWCGPCKRISPFFYDIANKIIECHFVVVDIDKFEDITEEYNIVSVPTFIFLKNNKIYEILKGANEQTFLNILVNMFKEDFDDTLTHDNHNNLESNNEEVETSNLELETNNEEEESSNLELETLPDAFNSDFNNFSFL